MLVSRLYLYRQKMGHALGCLKNAAYVDLTMKSSKLVNNLNGFTAPRSLPDVGHVSELLQCSRKLHADSQMQSTSRLMLTSVPQLQPPREFQLPQLSSFLRIRLVLKYICSAPYRIFFSFKVLKLYFTSRKIPSPKSFCFL